VATAAVDVAVVAAALAAGAGPRAPRSSCAAS
jgi:hypothetical protein